MIYLIIGHRGTGKTFWLKKLKKKFMDFCKTNLNKEKYYFIDLDEEIEKKTGQTISDFFFYKNTNNKSDPKHIKNHKEKRDPTEKTKDRYFRPIEQNTLNKLIDKYKNTNNQVFIAVGAGFKNISKEETSPSCHIIHLIRETDFQGRVFLNRPRLITNKTPYEEYMSLYYEREKFYKKIKEESFVLPEGDFEFDEGEKLLFNLKAGKLNSIITLNKNSLPAHKEKWPDFINKRLAWGLCFFELRDDQLNTDDLSILLKVIPKEKQLLSFRTSKNPLFLKQDLSSLTWDWPLEKGPPSLPPSSQQSPSSLLQTESRESSQTPYHHPPILSLHERKKETLDQLFEKLMKHKAHHFKLAVPIENFKELIQGHLWCLEDFKHRSFLPTSERGETGKWRWYRQIFGPQMKLHFIRESNGEVFDQPFLYEHLLFLNANQPNSEIKFSTPSNSSNHFSFAAVLGDPITHSASPAFHRKLFSKKGMIFTKITMKEEEFTKENLHILQKMGLVCAAVTSPLKKKAFQICDEIDSAANSIQAVNTLIFKDKKWMGSSTDQYGLQALLNSVEERELFKDKFSLKGNKRSVVVWGGGGLKNILEKELPFAHFYSARTGQKKEGIPFDSEKKLQRKKQEDKSPYTIIWAVGRNRMPKYVFPPSSWKPKWVIDLNYTENSPGKEYALLVGAEYISGTTMFKYQAKKQQQIFSKIFNKYTDPV